MCRHISEQLKPSPSILNLCDFQFDVRNKITDTILAMLPRNMSNFELNDIRMFIVPFSMLQFIWKKYPPFILFNTNLLLFVISNHFSSMYILSLLEREGCLNFLNAIASIRRIHSGVTLNSFAASSSV